MIKLILLGALATTLFTTLSKNGGLNLFGSNTTRGTSVRYGPPGARTKNGTADEPHFRIILSSNVTPKSNSKNTTTALPSIGIKNTTSSTTISSVSTTPTSLKNISTTFSTSLNFSEKGSTVEAVTEAISVSLEPPKFLTSTVKTTTKNLPSTLFSSTTTLSSVRSDINVSTKSSIFNDRDSKTVAASSQTLTKGNDSVTTLKMSTTTTTPVIEVSSLHSSLPSVRTTLANNQRFEETATESNTNSSKIDIPDSTSSPRLYTTRRASTTFHYENTTKSSLDNESRNGENLTKSEMPLFTTTSSILSESITDSSGYSEILPDLTTKSSILIESTESIRSADASPIVETVTESDKWYYAPSTVLKNESLSYLPPSSADLSSSPLQSYDTPQSASTSNETFIYRNLSRPSGYYLPPRNVRLA